MKKILLLFILIICCFGCEQESEVVGGCTDPIANNYDLESENNDAICTYTTSIIPDHMIDLCGIWISSDYSCPDMPPEEVFMIKHFNNAFTTATKIIGDDCVTSGNISWQGNYTENPFIIEIQMGSPNSPNMGFVSTGEVLVVDANYIVATWLGDDEIIFNKADAEQINMLNHQQYSVLMLQSLLYLLHNPSFLHHKEHDHLLPKLL